jgi:hypothetical protein
MSQGLFEIDGALLTVVPANENSQSIFFHDGDLEAVSWYEFGGAVSVTQAASAGISVACATATGAWAVTCTQDAAIAVGVTEYDGAVAGAVQVTQAASASVAVTYYAGAAGAVEALSVTGAAGAITCASSDAIGRSYSERGFLIADAELVRDAQANENCDRIWIVDGALYRQAFAEMPSGRTPQAQTASASAISVAVNNATVTAAVTVVGQSCTVLLSLLGGYFYEANVPRVVTGDDAGIEVYVYDADTGFSQTVVASTPPTIYVVVANANSETIIVCDLAVINVYGFSASPFYSAAQYLHATTRIRSRVTVTVALPETTVV